MSTQTFNSLPWPASAPARRSRAPPPPVAAAGTVLSGPLLWTRFPPAPHRQRPPRKPTSSFEHPGHLLPAQRAWSPLDVPFVPEREREQPPQLPAQVLAARDVVVDEAPDGVRPEEALPGQPFGRERLAGERLEVAPQPGGGRNREPALAAAQELVGNQRRGRLAKQDLLAQAPHLVPAREPEREVRPR